MKLHELYTQVTSAIIKDLEGGVATWVKPWKSGAKGGIMPYNAVTGRQEMTRQTSESKKQDGDANITVLFGTDEHGKPRAACFEAANPDLITKAAAAMK